MRRDDFEAAEPTIIACQSLKQLGVARVFAQELLEERDGARHIPDLGAGLRERSDRRGGGIARTVFFLENGNRLMREAKLQVEAPQLGAAGHEEQAEGDGGNDREQQRMLPAKRVPDERADGASGADHGALSLGRRSGTICVRSGVAM